MHAFLLCTSRIIHPHSKARAQPHPPKKMLDLPSPNQKITLTSLPLLALPSSNPTPPEHFIHLIHNLLTPVECAQVISTHQNLIPSNVTPSTKRDRELFEDERLAEMLWERLTEFYGEDRVRDEDGQWWRAKSLNERLRLCRYSPGE